MSIGLILQFFFGLLITVLFCAAAVIAARRAPRQLLWLSLAAASRCFVTMAGGISLIYVNRMQNGRPASDFGSLMSVQAIFSGLSNLLLFGGAMALLLFLLGEHENASVAEQRQYR